MNNSCLKNEQIINDFFYGETELTSELKEHMESCERCSKYLQSLNTMKTEMAVLSKELEFDKFLVDKIIDEYTIKEKTNKFKKDYFIFAAISFGILFTSVCSIKFGYLTYVLLLYLVAFVMCLMFVPIYIKFSKNYM